MDIPCSLLENLKGLWRKNVERMYCATDGKTPKLTFVAKHILPNLP
jgi:hypothetical protein